MNRRSFRRVVVVLAATVGVAACGADAVSPLPVQPAGPTLSTPTLSPPSPSAVLPIPAPTGSPSRPPPASARPAPPAPTRTLGTPRTTPPPTDATPACQGAVRYDLPLAETEIELLKSLCFATGAVLRIQGIGPGLVTVDRPELVSQQYEAGVVDIRFVRAGTVAVTIPKDGREHTITVVVR
ncbi:MULTISPECIES: hypothetical protein [Micromonospora]|uniref:hypothetical protein n=1 Tax=Micromonospora TaxID=1873 RepID=UPI001EE8E6BC|nr:MULTISPECIES: hypothetical protein [Micromonospora]MCG5448254.1 hypothetical protein [Micromonospora hortensis]MCX5117464.1 hypothetical protein [Micromonospora sp. NBC_00362]WTI10447.1 hypothetical protein OHB44_12545 [Micromonospora sp. NBC_00821]